MRQERNARCPTTFEIVFLEMINEFNNDILPEGGDIDHVSKGAFVA